MNKLYTVRQVADNLGISEHKVRQYLASGKLKGSKLGANGKDRSRLHWRVKEKDLNAFIKNGEAVEHTPSKR